MYRHSGNTLFHSKEKTLTDTLLLLDTDDDGGIRANKNHPDTEDMTWNFCLSRCIWR